MSTMGLRGVLAAIFITSTGLLTGMAAPSVPAPDGHAVVAGAAGQTPGMIDHIRHRACLVSLGAERRDEARQRRRECDQRLVARH